MKLFNKITIREKVKGFISFFIVFFFMNNLIAFGSENKFNVVKNRNNDEEFEKIFFQDPITFIEYDDLESQLKIFFGSDYDRSDNNFFPDLYIINISDSLRQMYKSKLNDMAINEINYNINK